MTTLRPREPYSEEKLATLYPQELQLEQVQVLLRHGERTPVNARFQNAGLPKYWPYCTAARHLRAALLQSDNQWDHMSFRRQLETFNGKDDSATLVSGPGGEKDTICLPGELTDLGRQTTHALGSRLRHLYVNQLKFIPATLTASVQDQLYIRATPIPRALESVQQALSGLYPPSARAPDLPPPDIITRQASDETLFPNEGSCKRFSQLALAFGERAASIWNDSPELAYVTSKIGKWMPPDSPKVEVDSHPRLSGVMDTINSTLAHGSATKLPREFYDQKVIDAIDKIGVEEWFAGYTESNEYRRLGIGSLVGDITARLVERAQSVHSQKVKGNEVASGKDIRFAMSGCHDTTLAAILTSLGAFEGERWPPYTSHVAIELLRDRKSLPAESTFASTGGLWERIFGPATGILKQPKSSRTPLQELSEGERKGLDGFFVRVRYNDAVMSVPGCRAPGKHYRDDESLCTLSAFKDVVDKFTPRDWKKECGMRIGQSAFPEKVEEAGY
ncbi:histidine acid phosphatase [Elsinoe ampelina]|uniref:3-phytase n=1 Tax=Elsinoe ampelina TaxID=302913 RepID=A0A6A6FZ31_9PEZI|nr:histidine acid phosphatase [Elsinoe ampelina]